MRQTMGAIIALSMLGMGCATLHQETRMFHGPFGRTEVGAIMVAADPASSKVLVQTYDGDLWIFDVDAPARGRLSTLRVGDEVILAFDDRLAGTRAVSITTVPPGRHPLTPGTVSIASLLPVGVVFGAPAVAPAGTTAGTAVAGTTGAAGTLPGAAGTVFGAPGVVVGAGGIVPGGILLGPGGTIVAGAPVTLVGPGVIVPGFGTFSGLPAGLVAAQDAVALGLTPGAFIPNPLGPMGGPSVAKAGGVQPGRTPFTQGNFTPGTTSPGVTTANPNATGAPVVQGPFTPGTIAPGVSQQRGNAPPPAAGATTVGPGTTTGTTTTTTPGGSIGTTGTTTGTPTTGTTTTTPTQPH